MTDRAITDPAKTDQAKTDQAKTEPAVTEPAPLGREAALLRALGPRSIVLVGMMGAGKSSVGRRLALRLGLPFADADNELEIAAGMTIPEIFAVHGEENFRAGEMKVIIRLLANGPQVMATGGGAFMRPETREAIRAQAISVWLKADEDVLIRRVRRRTDRPLLQTEDPEATLRRLLAERSPVYALADLTVRSSDVPHERVVDDIVAAVEAWCRASGEAAGPAQSAAGAE